MYEWFYVRMKPLFMGKPRPKRLTSNHMVSQKRRIALPGDTSSPSISLSPNWAGPIQVYDCTREQYVLVVS